MKEEHLSNLYYNQQMILDEIFALQARMQELQSPVQQPAHADGADTNQPPAARDTADTLTGWEQEKTFFFAPQAASADLLMDTALDRSAAGLGGIVGSLVQLGRAVEWLESPVPMRDATTMPPEHNGRKKRLSVGQKEDGHSGYDFEMKM